MSRKAPNLTHTLFLFLSLSSSPTLSHIFTRMSTNPAVWHYNFFFIVTKRSTTPAMPYQRLEPSEQASSMPAPTVLTPTISSASPMVLYSAPDNSHESYDGRTSVVLGTVQLVAGVLSIICQVILYTIQSIAMFISAGIWCGVPVSQCRHMVWCTSKSVQAYGVVYR